MLVKQNKAEYLNAHQLQEQKCHPFSSLLLFTLKVGKRQKQHPVNNPVHWTTFKIHRVRGVLQIQIPTMPLKTIRTLPLQSKNQLYTDSYLLDYWHRTFISSYLINEKHFHLTYPKMLSSKVFVIARKSQRIFTSIMISVHVIISINQFCYMKQKCFNESEIVNRQLSLLFINYCFGLFETNLEKEILVFIINNQDNRKILQNSLP